MNETPMHIAIIMDGNGRWAIKHDKKRTYGHYIGSKVVEQITKEAIKIGIKYLTLYAFSTENWKRPKAEIRFITSILRVYIRKSENLFLENHIQFKVIGDISVYDAKTQDLILSLVKKTENNKKMRLTLAINYGSRMEIIRAIQKIVSHTKTGRINPEKIDENIVKNYLYTYDMPDVDLLIRTGSEKRLSNFLLWQSAYAELIFLDKYWPEFTTDDLANAIEEFRTRHRRFGGL